MKLVKLIQKRKINLIFYLEENNLINSGNKKFITVTDVLIKRWRT